MKTKNHQLKIAAFLAFAAACLGFNFGPTAAAQNENRERVIEKQTPTPRPTPKPAFTPTPYVTPMPPTQTATPASVQTLADLQARLRVALLRPELRRGQVGVKIVSLETNKTIFEENAEKYFMPASNMKSYTVAAALERLSPDFRFVTSVYAPARPDAAGTVKNLSIYGRGDVSFSSGFSDGDYFRALEALAQKIVQAGVKRVEGDLIGDESYFTGNPIPNGWEWDDLQWYYGAEISALAYNDNAVDLVVKPGSSGAPCIVQVLPANTVIRINNTCRTTASGTKRALQVTKKLDQNVFEVSGSMPAGDKTYSGNVAVSRPAQLFVALLRQALEKNGVVVTGQTRVVAAGDKAFAAAASQTPPVEIARVESPPLGLIAARTMKPSNNTYTETILWSLGEQVGDKSVPGRTSAERGLSVVQAFLRQVGIAPDSVVQWDGSGLSRHNLITPNSAVQLYTYMAKQSRFASAWQNSLTIGGTDGTLQNRFKGTSAAGNVRGKTGTIDQVSSLSGYVTTAGDEKLVFSIIVNGVPDARARVATIDMMVNMMANFNGRVN